MGIRTIVVHRGLLEIENGSKDALAEIFFCIISSRSSLFTRTPDDELTRTERTGIWMKGEQHTGQILNKLSRN